MPRQHVFALYLPHHLAREPGLSNIWVGQRSRKETILASLSAASSIRARPCSAIETQLVTFAHVSS